MRSRLPACASTTLTAFDIVVDEALRVRGHRRPGRRPGATLAGRLRTAGTSGEPDNARAARGPHRSGRFDALRRSRQRHGTPAPTLRPKPIGPSSPSIAGSSTRPTRMWRPTSPTWPSTRRVAPRAGKSSPRRWPTCVPSSRASSPSATPSAPISTPPTPATSRACSTSLGFDAVTLHPYLGKEALQPFLDRADKACIVLCRTSNQGAGELQDLETPTGPLWEAVASRVRDEWNDNGNCMLVVGATLSGGAGARSRPVPGHDLPGARRRRPGRRCRRGHPGGASTAAGAACSSTPRDRSSSPRTRLPSEAAPRRPSAASVARAVSIVTAHPRGRWRRARTCAVLAHRPRSSRCRALRRPGKRRHRRRCDRATHRGHRSSMPSSPGASEQRPDLVVVGPDDPLAAGIVDALSAAGDPRLRSHAPRPRGSKPARPGQRRSARLPAYPMPESHVFDRGRRCRCLRAPARPGLRGQGRWARPRQGRLRLYRRARHPRGHRPCRPANASSVPPAIGSSCRRELAGPEASVFAICDGHDLPRHRAPLATTSASATARPGPQHRRHGRLHPARGRRRRDLLDEIERRILAPVLAELRRARRPLHRVPLRRVDARPPRAPWSSSSTAAWATPKRRCCCPCSVSTWWRPWRPPSTVGSPDWSCRRLTGAAVCVVLASGGYPASLRTGLPIGGLDR